MRSIVHAIDFERHASIAPPDNHVMNPGICWLYPSKSSNTHNVFYPFQLNSSTLPLSRLDDEGLFRLGVSEKRKAPPDISEPHLTREVCYHGSM